MVEQHHWFSIYESRSGGCCAPVIISGGVAVVLVGCSWWRFADDDEDAMQLSVDRLLWWFVAVRGAFMKARDTFGCGMVRLGS